MPTIGLFGANMGPCAAPAAAGRCAALAEELGYDSLWMGEHVVAPSPRMPPSMIEPAYPILDPLVTLAHVAAQTEHVRLATGIVILPQRNPVVLAKELATLDVLSGGRLVFGMGVGYVEPEMRAVGVPMDGRGARADEYLGAMRSLWSDDAPAFAGEHVRFDGVEAHPRPVQRPIPVVVGGHTTAAHRRTVHHGDGWYGFMLDRRATAENLASLRREADAAGRDFTQLEISVSPSEPLERGVIEDYEQLGVDRLVLVPPPGFWQVPGTSLQEFEEFVRSNAPAQRRSASVRTIAS
jgi:probable F420-dependent oxidoreductase